MLQATLERHLAQFHLSPMSVGMFFMLYGGAYALLNPFWGWMADKVSSTLVIMIGAFLLGLGFLLLGPVPGLGLHFSYNLCILSVVIAGAGLGAQLVAAFSEAQRSAVAGGFPDNLTTYAMVSSIWTSAFALGAFVGPTPAGRDYLKKKKNYFNNSLFQAHCTMLLGSLGQPCSLLGGMQLSV